MKQSKLSIFCILLLIFPGIFTSCQKNEADDTLSSTCKTAIPESGFPHASPGELAAFDRDHSIIHYQVARYYAYEEIESALYEPLTIGSDYRLTAYPVIIYDYDCRPKYYEFGIVTSGKIVATVTTIAQKESDNVINFLFNTSLEYPQAGSTSYFVGNYPTVFYGIKSEPGLQPKILYLSDGVAAPEIPSCDVVKNYQQLINSMDDESQKEHESFIQELLAELELVKEEAAQFWESAISIDDIRDLSDDELLEKIRAKLGKANNWDQSIIPAYASEKMKKTRWSGWCGPCAVAWAYRGLYANYPKTSSNYLRIRGDGSYNNFFDNQNDRAYYSLGNDANAATNSNNTDHGLYIRLRNECVKTGNSYPMYQGGLNRGMKAITNNEYKVNLTTAAHDRIRNNKLPLINLIGYSWSFHYLVAFGSGYSKKNNGRIKERFLLVTDNGAASCRYHYYPYWRSQKSDPGIRYKVYK